MSERKFEVLATALGNAQSDKELVRLLTKVEPQIANWPEDTDKINELRERDCLKQIMSALISTEKQTTELSLRILENCCMDHACTGELVANHDLLDYLEKILERYPNDESIYRRIFRLVGNMCLEESSYYVNVSKAIVDRWPRIITKTIAYLGSTIEANCHVSEATKIAGIRALRELVSCNTVKNLVMEHKVMNYANLLLIKYSTAWTPENDQGIDVLKAILKLLYEYSKHGRKSIVCHSKCEPSSKREKTKNSGAKCAEITQLLFRILASMTLTSESEIKCCTLILKTLQKCQNHAELFEEQVKCGIVEALFDKMKALLGPGVLSSNVDHEIKRDQKSKKTSCSKDSTEQLLTIIIKLLRKLANDQSILSQLANELLALIKTSEHLVDRSTMTYIEEILDLIMRYPPFLLSIMQTDFVVTLESLKCIKHRMCSVCDNYKSISEKVMGKLRRVAESRFEDIAYELLRGEVSMREKLVLAIPYVIRSEPELIRLMIDFGGLGILMKLLKDDSHLQERCIRSLCAMAPLQLYISKDTTYAEISVIRFCSDQEKLIETLQVVKFKLDDGSVLKADRLVVCKHSDFFSSLLHGGFKESYEDEITLHDVSNKTFKCLLHLMECDMKKVELKKFDVDLNTHLDLIVLCDRFLMPDFCTDLMNSVVEFRMSTDSIPVIYQWSMESRTNFLRVECIAYAFVTEIAQIERVKMFKNLFNLGYKDQLIVDIQNLMISDMIMKEEESSSHRGKKRNFFEISDRYL